MGATPQLLTPGDSWAALSINAEEFPALAELVMYAEDIPRYLRELGIDDEGEGDLAGAPATAGE